VTGWLSQHLDEAYRKLDREFLDSTPAESGSAPIAVRKLAAYVQVSCCALTDSTGVNHCEHPAPVAHRLPWTWRARERWWDLRERVARRIAGHTWPIEED
jgi:hypothetical protein